MPRIYHVCIQFIIFLFITQFLYGQSPHKLYATKLLKADLHFLKTRLEKTHPALYRYTPKPAFNIFFDSLNNAINKPMNDQEFLSLITLLNAKIGDGHTMFLPGNETTDYNNNKERFLPFTLAYIDGRLYVTENCSRENNIKKGEEVVSINGIATDTIMSALLARQIRDGYNETYPIWILNHYFAAYYSFAYGNPTEFSLELKGVRDKKQVMALPKDSIRFFRESSYSVIENKGITIEENNGTGILSIKSFDPDLLKDLYKQEYKYVIDSIFRLLKLHQTKNLILDLRDNQGGDFESGRYLLSYLFKQPANYLLDGKEARLIKPQKNHFTGELFVLINGGSFSNTAIVSACLEREQRAVFIGEETGGNKHIICGNPQEITLPNTKIRAFISTATFRIIEGHNDGHGVLPAYTTFPAREDVDTAKNLALKLISTE